METTVAMGEQGTALRLWDALVRAHAAAQMHVHADIERHGLTPGEFGMLETLHRRGPMLVGDLQRSILVSSGGATFLVGRLEKRGLVERNRCLHDRRACYASLTPAGEALIARILPEHEQWVEEVFAGLGETERIAAVELLKMLGSAAATLGRETVAI